MSHSLLFVCTGNTCRSPMAEQIFTKLALEAGLPWTAASAGTHAAPGMPPSRGAAAALLARSLHPETHRARSVDADMLEAADAVYVMERAQRARLIDRFPQHAAKICVLREASDIEDPVGGDSATFEKSAASIEAALQTIILREKETHGQNPR